jgi:multidrug efflux system outer membrane protein
MKISLNQHRIHSTVKLLITQRYECLLPLFSYQTVIGLSMLSLTACMQDTRPNLAQALPAHWHHQQQDSAELPTPDLRGWWKAFNAPDLDMLVDESLAQNLTLAVSREHITAARIISHKNYSNFLPDLHFRTNDVAAPNATSSYFQADFDSTWELGLFGKKNASQQVVDGQLGDVEAQSQMARVSLVAEVVRTWIQLRTAQQQLKLVDQLILQSKQQYQLTSARINLGLAANAALLGINTSIAQQTQMQQANQLEIEQALQQLALLQGLTAPDPSWSIDTTQPVVGEFSVQTVPTDVIRIRPDIQQAQANVLLAAGQFGLARAARYPSVNISASFIYSLVIIGHFILHSYDDNTVASVGPVIDIPLFDWGLRKSAADARASELRAATLSYRQTILEAVNEVESSLAAVNTTKKRIDQQNLVIKAANETIKTHQTLSNLGLASRLEVLEQQQVTLQSQIELLGMQKDHDLAYVSVYKALGGAPLDQESSETYQKYDSKDNQTHATKPSTLMQQQGG